MIGIRKNFILNFLIEYMKYRELKLEVGMSLLKREKDEVNETDEEECFLLGDL